MDKYSILWFYMRNEFFGRVICLFSFTLYERYRDQGVAQTATAPQAENQIIGELILL